MEALDMTDIAVEQLHISTEHENLTASALEDGEWRIVAFE